MHPAFSLVLAGILIGLAWHDARSRRLPNRLVALVALLWPVNAVLMGVSGVLAVQVGIAFLVLLAGILLWLPGWLGAGDAKLLAALSLWAAPGELAGMLLATVLAGAALAAGMTLAVLLRPRRPVSAAAAMGSVTGGAAGRRPSVPYGVAIAAGGLWLIGHLSLS